MISQNRSSIRCIYASFSCLVLYYFYIYMEALCSHPFLMLHSIPVISLCVSASHFYVVACSSKPRSIRRWLGRWFLSTVPVELTGRRPKGATLCVLSQIVSAVVVFLSPFHYTPQQPATSPRQIHPNSRVMDKGDVFGAHPE